MRVVVGEEFADVGDGVGDGGSGFDDGADREFGSVVGVGACEVEELFGDAGEGGGFPVVDRLEVGEGCPDAGVLLAEEAACVAGGAASLGCL